MAQYPSLQALVVSHIIQNKLYVSCESAFVYPSKSGGYSLTMVLCIFMLYLNVNGLQFPYVYLRC